MLRNEGTKSKGTDYYNIEIKAEQLSFYADDSGYDGGPINQTTQENSGH
jgi:hypothetical protein